MYAIWCSCMNAVLLIDLHVVGVCIGMQDAVLLLGFVFLLSNCIAGGPRVGLSDQKPAKGQMGGIFEQYKCIWQLGWELGT